MTTDTDRHGLIDLSFRGPDRLAGIDLTGPHPKATLVPGTELVIFADGWARRTTWTAPDATTVEWFPPELTDYSKFGNGAEHWISEPRTGLRFGPFTTNEREEIDANLIAAQIDPLPLWTVDYDLPTPR